MSARLTCKDGTVITISDETEQELRKAFAEKAYPVGTWFYRNYASHIVKLVEEHKNYVALQTADGVLKNRSVWCDRSTYVNNTQKVPLSVIKKLTLYPEGLRPIKVKIVENLL